MALENPKMRSVLRIATTTNPFLQSLAVGAYDNDGALDVLIATNDGIPALLKNNAAKGKRVVTFASA
jgi:hypothetical protein